MIELLGVSDVVAAKAIEQLLTAFISGPSQIIDQVTSVERKKIRWGQYLCEMYQDEQGPNRFLFGATTSRRYGQQTHALHKAFIRCLVGRRTSITTHDRGYGVAPFLTEPEDIICHIDGVPNSMVLRRQDCGSYTIIGPILLHYMDDREVGPGNAEWQRIELI